MQRRSHYRRICTTRSSRPSNVSRTFPGTLPSPTSPAGLFSEEANVNTATVLAGNLGSLLSLEPVVETIAICHHQPHCRSGKMDRQK